MTIKDLIERLQGYHPDEPVAASLWLTDDVDSRARELDVTLTQEQKEEILDDVEHSHDANIGINWGVLDFYILQYRDEPDGGE